MTKALSALCPTRPLTPHSADQWFDGKQPSAIQCVAVTSSLLPCTKRLIFGPQPISVLRLRNTKNQLRGGAFGRHSCVPGLYPDRRRASDCLFRLCGGTLGRRGEAAVGGHASVQASAKPGHPCCSCRISACVCVLGQCQEPSAVEQS